MSNAVFKISIKSDECCFFWIDSWVTCSTKNDWAAWIQALAVVITLLLPAFWHWRKRCKAKRVAKAYGVLLEKHMSHLVRASEILRDIYDPIYEGKNAYFIDEVLLQFKYFHIPSFGQMEAILFLDKRLFVEVNNVLSALSLRSEVISGLKNNEYFLKNESGGYLFAFDQAEKLEKLIIELRETVKAIKDL